MLGLMGRKKSGTGHPRRGKRARAEEGTGAGEGGMASQNRCVWRLSPLLSPHNSEKPRLDTIPSTKEERELRGGL